MDPNNPPLGIPLLVWLLIWFIGGPTTIALLCTKAAARLPSVFGALGRWWQAREPATASQRVSRAEIDRLQEDYKRLSDARESDREEHRREIEEFRQELAEFKTSLTLMHQRFWAAMGYIRILVAVIQRLDADHPLPDPPDKLREFL